MVPAWIDGLAGFAEEPGAIVRMLPRQRGRPPARRRAPVLLAAAVTTGWAAIVVDDLVSVDPWTPRMLEIRGRAEAVPTGGAQQGSPCSRRRSDITSS